MHSWCCCLGRVTRTCSSNRGRRLRSSSGSWTGFRVVRPAGTVTERRADGSGLIPATGLRTFATRVFTELGVPVEDAAIVADSLVEADLRGVSSHGVLRIPSYVKRILDGGSVLP